MLKNMADINTASSGLEMVPQHVWDDKFFSVPENLSSTEEFLKIGKLMLLGIILLIFLLKGFAYFILYICVLFERI